jgi:carboxylesterase type B
VKNSRANTSATQGTRCDAHQDPVGELRLPRRADRPAGEPEWPPYTEPDRPCLLIDRQDAVAGDIDTHIRATLGHPGAQLPVAGTGIARISPEVSLWTG